MKSVEKVASKVEKAYHPPGHPHPIGTYLSGSMIVKYTAEEIVKRELAKRAGEKDDISRFWTYRGDALGDRAFENIPWKEVRSTIDIPGHEGWVIAGHCDGVDVVDGEVVVLEHKAHVNATGDKVEAAKRQALLYMSMMWGRLQEALENGEHWALFDVASWADDEPYFRWVEDYEPGGVIVAIARPFPPPIVDPTEVDSETLEEVLDFYKRKATVIVDAILKKDPVYARENWDVEAEEFGFLEEIDPADEKTLEQLYDEYKEVNDAINELEDRQKQLKQQIGHIHDKNGLEVIEVGPYRSRWVESRGRRTAKVGKLLEDGLDEYVKDGAPFRYIRVDTMAAEE